MRISAKKRLPHYPCTRKMTSKATQRSRGPLTWWRITCRKTLIRLRMTSAKSIWIVCTRHSRPKVLSTRLKPLLIAKVATRLKEKRTRVTIVSQWCKQSEIPAWKWVTCCRVTSPIETWWFVAVLNLSGRSLKPTSVAPFWNLRNLTRTSCFPKSSM